MIQIAIYIIHFVGNFTTYKTNSSIAEIQSLIVLAITNAYMEMILVGVVTDVLRLLFTDDIDVPLGFCLMYGYSYYIGSTIKRITNPELKIPIQNEKSLCHHGSNLLSDGLSFLVEYLCELYLRALSLWKRVGESSVAAKEYFKSVYNRGCEVALSIRANILLLWKKLTHAKPEQPAKPVVKKEQAAKPLKPKMLNKRRSPRSKTPVRKKPSVDLIEEDKLKGLYVDLVGDDAVDMAEI